MRGNQTRKNRMKTIGRKVSWGLLAAAVMVANSARCATHDVSIVGFAFDPPSVSINTGDSVRWTEKDGAFHSSTSDDGLWDSGSLPFNGQFSFQFSSAGIIRIIARPTRL
jgi:plastocyanin